MPLPKDPKSRMAQVMREFKTHQLHVGKSAKKVSSRKQAIAIGLNDRKGK